MLERVEERFRHLAPQGDFCSLRFVRERSEVLAVRQNIVQPMETSEDSGAMLTVYAGDSMGYAATGDVSLSGLQRAAEQARGWACRAPGGVWWTSRRCAPPRLPVHMPHTNLYRGVRRHSQTRSICYAPSVPA